MSTCFVIMGFGTKTDYRTSRELDLDKTYRHIIKPAVQAAGLDCVRADEIPHAGTIDVPMFEQLLNADLVIADLSTANLNAIYELGIRHALKPYTTIVIAEEQFSNPFDVNHLLIRRYRHDGKVMDIDEVARFSAELTRAIKDVMTAQRKDSPVYTFLNLLPPTLAAQAVAAFSVANADSVELPPDSIANPAMAVLKDQVAEAMRKKDFITAKALLGTLRQIAPRQSQWIQQLALATYKSKSPDELSALREAERILLELQPASSKNGETLGLWGAVHKRLFDITKDPAQLNVAISAYERGYYLLCDYYNGINFAYLLNVRATLARQRIDAITDYVAARRVRKEVIKIAEDKFTELDAIQDVENRDERYWVLATKAEALVGLGEEQPAQLCLKQAEPFSEAWMRDSTQEQLSRLRVMLKNSPLYGLTEQ